MKGGKQNQSKETLPVVLLFKRIIGTIIKFFLFVQNTKNLNFYFVVWAFKRNQINIIKN